MSTIHEIAAYNGSRDYARLAELAKTASIICIVNYADREQFVVRDVAHTFYSNYTSTGNFWQINARGTGYVWADTLDKFVTQCEKYGVEFIDPPQKG